MKAKYYMYIGENVTQMDDVNRRFVVKCDQSFTHNDRDMTGIVFAANDDAPYRPSSTSDSWINMYRAMLHKGYPVFVEVTLEYVKENFKNVLEYENFRKKVWMKQLSDASRYEYLSTVQTEDLNDLTRKIKGLRDMVSISDRQEFVLESIDSILEQRAALSIDK